MDAKGRIDFCSKDATKLKPTHLSFSTRLVYLSVGAGLLLSFIFALLIADRLSHTIGDEMRNRETESLFASVESGPLAIARLQSAAIAQQQLTRIMSNPRTVDRGIVSVGITGGENRSFEYASWAKPNDSKGSCLTKSEKIFTFEDTVNPFVITLLRDSCMKLPEERTILIYSTTASFLIAAFATFLLFAAVGPVALSIRNAINELAKGRNARLELVFYTPVRELLNKAIRSIELENFAAIGTLASQVAHDIRSPLSALNLVMGTIKDLPEEKRLIMRSAVQRINDIANALLKHGKGQIDLMSKQYQENEPVLLVALVDSIVSEKRTQFREMIGIDIEGDLTKGYGLFAKINPIELSRVISNLVNNSVEAFENAKGRVDIGICVEDGKIVISVQDNGKGIPPNILSKLGGRGVTHGKAGSLSGSGLGVAHARETVESAGGTISVSSSLGMGTIIKLALPKCDAPDWFIQRILVQPNRVVVSVDDDQSIHQIWSGRFASAIRPDAQPNYLKFTSLVEFETWVRNNHHNDHQYLIDYEFQGQNGSGLDTIERLQIQGQSILVTSRYEEPQIQSKVKSLKIKILPKNLAPFVPIEIESVKQKLGSIFIDDDSLINRPIETNSSPMKISEEKVRYDLCLIDDDQELIGVVWAMEAASKGLKIRLFATPQAFVAESHKIDPLTPIYVDVSLGNGVNGLDVAHDIHKMGFTEINLATGYQADSMKVPPFIASVVGKDFPNVRYTGTPTS